MGPGAVTRMRMPATEGVAVALYDKAMGSAPRAIVQHVEQIQHVLGQSGVFRRGGKAGPQGMAQRVMPRRAWNVDIAIPLRVVPFARLIVVHPGHSCNNRDVRKSFPDAGLSLRCDRCKSMKR